MLSKQLLTGSNGFDHAFGYDIEYEGYYEEATKPEEAFYFPSEDLRRKNPDLVATVQQSWNCASLLIRVIHAYELFLRASTDTDLDEGEEKFDTLAFIKKYAPRFSDKFLAKAFPNADTRKEAKKLLDAFKNIYKHLADGGAFYCFHSDAEKVNFFNATVDAGFHYSTTCIWVKNSLVLGRMDYQMRHEPVIYAFKDTAKHKFYGDRKQTTIWEYDRPTKSKLHPTSKTIPLIAYPIRMSSLENSIVMDLFGGSGSTMMAAEQINRTAYLMELDPKYASAIVRRYVAAKQGTDDIRVIRGGQELKCSEVYIPTSDDLAFKDDKVNQGGVE